MNGNTEASPATCYYAIDVPEGQLSLKVEETNPTSADRRVRANGPNGGTVECGHNSGPVICYVNSPAAGRWTILVSNYEYGDTQSTDAFSIKATYGAGINCGTQSSPIVLSTGVQQSAATPGAVTCYFAVDVPAGQLSLRVDETNPTSTDRRVQVTDPNGATTNCGHNTGPVTCFLNSPAAGRWSLMVSNYEYGTPQSTDPFTIKATYGAGTNCGTLSSPTVLATGVQQSGATAGEAACYFAIDVPAGQLSLRVDETNPTSADRRVQLNDPTGATTNCGHNTGPVTCYVNSPNVGRWLVLVRNYEYGNPQGTDAFTVKATYGAGTNCGTQSSPTVLSAGVQESGATAGAVACYFAIDVPAGQLSLQFDETNPTSADRRVQVNDPSGATTNCGHSAGPVSCSVVGPAAGRWYVMVWNYEYGAPQSTDPFTIRATYFQITACGTKSTPHELGNGTQENATGAGQVYCYYTLEVPSGQSSLDVIAVSTTGAETDLHVNNAPWPEGSSGSTCVDNSQGVSATCHVTNPTPGTWWIAVIGPNTIRTLPVSFAINATYSHSPPTVTRGAIVVDGGSNQGSSLGESGQGSIRSEGEEWWAFASLLVVGVAIVGGATWLKKRKKSNHAKQFDDPGPEPLSRNPSGSPVGTKVDGTSSSKPPAPTSPDGVELVWPKETYADYVGGDHLKQLMREAIWDLQHPEEADAVGGEPNRGILLYGPPNTGKTFFARCTAGEFRLPFFEASSLKRMYSGETEQLIRRIFNSARANGPAIIFFDEIDAIAQDRQKISPGASFERSYVTALLTELDGIRKSERDPIVVAATNRFELLDPAVTRQGRLGIHILVDEAETDKVESLLKFELRKIIGGAKIDWGVVRDMIGEVPSGDVKAIANVVAQNYKRERRTRGVEPGSPPHRALATEDLISAIRTLNSRTASTVSS